METTTKLPHWDMTVIYPSLESPEFGDDFEGVASDIEKLARLYDQHDVREKEAVEVDDGSLRSFEELVENTMALMERLWTVNAYIFAFFSTDTRNELAQAKLSELQQRLVLLSQLQTRLTAWLGAFDVEALIERSQLARDHAFMLRKTKVDSQHLMLPAQEELAAELELTGSTAWEKLYDNVTSQISVRLETPDGVQDVPMSVVRNMAHDPDREVRRRAYHAEIESWKQASVPLAAALNSIKGEANGLGKRRNWDSALDVGLFQNNINRESLEAMLHAARESFPDFRRYLQSKAQALEVESLAWYDIFAPVGKSESSWEYGDSRLFILSQFEQYSPRLREFAARAFDEHWIDAEPRPGKQDGAYCMSVRRGESRVMANYESSYQGMSTLAHELGHAYHNLNLAERTMFQRDTPMTLAETASIFCETIVRQAALERAGRGEQLTILEASLQGSCQVIVDITSRFLFERSVFEGRRERELSVEQLNDLMLDAQRQTYGDGLNPDIMHPYMWVAKGHYYGASRPFYNFPYMFGLLFGLGLYAQYQRDPDGFRAGYDVLLSSTGLADASTLAADFGIDISSPDFWRSSLDIVRQDIARFEQLVVS